MAADDENPQQSRSNLRLLVILALFAVGVVGVLFITQQLRNAAAIQDCVASGRRNCAPISTRG
jgi:hypothetical protein